MKKLIAVVVALSAFNASAALDSKSKLKYKFKGDTAYSSFCEAVVADDVKMLNKSFRRKVGEVASTKSGVIDLIVSDEGVKCNGSTLTEFSKKRDSKEVSAFLSKLK